MKLKALVAGVLTVSAILTPISIVNADSDSGGIPRTCHYYSDAQMNNYAFGCYSYVTEGLDPHGGHVSKYIRSDHRLFSTAKSNVDAFASNASNYQVARVAFAAAVVAGALASTTGVGVLAAITAVSAAAISKDAALNATRDNLWDAYNAIRTA